MQVQPLINEDNAAVIGGKTPLEFQIANSPEFFAVLSKSLYKRPLQAMVREVLCNAWDANIAVKTDKLVEVNMGGSTYVMTIKDYGTGIDPNKMQDIYCTYGNSTKTQDGTQTGGFGLGCKAPFAYTEQFEVINCYQGKKTIYSVVRSNAETGGKPAITQIMQVPTQETGLTVKIPYDQGDKNKIEKYIEELTTYTGNQINFRNDEFDDFELMPTTAQPYEFFKIQRELFKGNGYYMSSSILDNNGIFIQYGNVIYPIDRDMEYYLVYDIVDKFYCTFLRHKNMHLILKAPENSIAVTPSRESLHNCEKTRNTIKELLTRFVEMFYNVDNKYYYHDKFKKALKKYMYENILNKAENVFDVFSTLQFDTNEKIDNYGAYATCTISEEGLFKFWIQNWFHGDDILHFPWYWAVKLQYVTEKGWLDKELTKEPIEKLYACLLYDVYDFYARDYDHNEKINRFIFKWLKKNYFEPLEEALNNIIPKRLDKFAMPTRHWRKMADLPYGYWYLTADDTDLIYDSTKKKDANTMLPELTPRDLEILSNNVVITNKQSVKSGYYPGCTYWVFRVGRSKKQNEAVEKLLESMGFNAVYDLRAKPAKKISQISNNNDEDEEETKQVKSTNVRDLIDGFPPNRKDFSMWELVNSEPVDDFSNYKAILYTKENDWAGVNKVLREMTEEQVNIFKKLFNNSVLWVGNIRSYESILKKNPHLKEGISYMADVLIKEMTSNPKIIKHIGQEEKRFRDEYLNYYDYCRIKSLFPTYRSAEGAYSLFMNLQRHPVPEKIRKKYGFVDKVKLSKEEWALETLTESYLWECQNARNLPNPFKLVRYCKGFRRFLKDSLRSNMSYFDSTRFDFDREADVSFLVNHILKRNSL